MITFQHLDLRKHNGGVIGVFVTIKIQRKMDLGPAFLALYPALIGKIDFEEGLLLQLITGCVVRDRRWLHVCLGAVVLGVEAEDVNRLAYVCNRI